jgi:hypothetical protein
MQGKDDAAESKVGKGSKNGVPPEVLEEIRQKRKWRKEGEKDASIPENG